MSTIQIQHPFFASTINFLTMHDDRFPRDIKFCFENIQGAIHAHKFFLQTASTTFKEMFNGEFKGQDTITLKDIRPEIFEKVVHACYLEPIKVKQLEDAIDLYKAGEHYNMPDLKRIALPVILCRTHWSNAIYVYETARKYNIEEVLKKCHNIMDAYDYRVLISHLFREEDISEDAFSAVAKSWSGSHADLYMILEVFVELGRLKSYKKAIGEIAFASCGTELALSATLLTDDEKLAIIAGDKSDYGEYIPFLEMPKNLSSKHFGDTVEAKLSPKTTEANEYSVLIWTALLIASSSNKEYFETVLRRIRLGKDFLEAEVCDKAFARVKKGERMELEDLEYLFRVVESDVDLKKYFRYESGPRLDAGNKFRLVDKDQEVDNLDRCPCNCNPIVEQILISYDLHKKLNK